MTRPQKQDDKSIGDRIREVVETLADWLAPRPAPVPVPVPVRRRPRRR